MTREFEFDRMDFGILGYRPAIVLAEISYLDAFARPQASLVDVSIKLEDGEWMPLTRAVDTFKLRQKIELDIEEIVENEELEGMGSEVRGVSV